MEMVVYEATTDSDLTKIVNFIQSQPKESYVLNCFQQLKGSFTPQYFSTLLKNIQGLGIFICEDASGVIHLVHGRQIVTEKISTILFLFMDEADHQMENIQYFKELCLWLCKNDYEKYGITLHFGHYLIDDTYLKFAQETFGNALKVVSQKQFPDRMRYHIEIDVKAALAIT
jgi:hypothetical protein